MKGKQILYIWNFYLCNEIIFLIIMIKKYDCYLNNNHTSMVLDIDLFYLKFYFFISVLIYRLYIYIVYIYIFI